MEHKSISSKSKKKSISQKHLECKVCKERFWVTSKYLNHMNLHKHLLLSCNICNKSFFNQKLLDQHYVVHNEIITTFNCDKCPRKFLQQHQLVQHMQFHFSSAQSFVETQTKRVRFKNVPKSKDKSNEDFQKDDDEDQSVDDDYDYEIPDSPEDEDYVPETKKTCSDRTVKKARKLDVKEKAVTLKSNKANIKEASNVTDKKDKDQNIFYLSDAYKARRLHASDSRKGKTSSVNESRSSTINKASTNLKPIMMLPNDYGKDKASLTERNVQSKSSGNDKSKSSTINNTFANVKPAHVFPLKNGNPAFDSEKGKTLVTERNVQNKSNGNDKNKSSTINNTSANAKPAPVLPLKNSNPAFDSEKGKTSLIERNNQSKSSGNEKKKLSINNTSANLKPSDMSPLEISTYVIPSVTPIVDQKFLYVGPKQDIGKIQSIIDKMKSMPDEGQPIGKGNGSNSSIAVPKRSLPLSNVPNPAKIPRIEGLDSRGILEKKFVNDFIFVKVTPEYMKEMQEKTIKTNLAVDSCNQTAANVNSCSVPSPVINISASLSHDSGNGKLNISTISEHSFFTATEENSSKNVETVSIFCKELQSENFSDTCSNIEITANTNNLSCSNSSSSVNDLFNKITTFEGVLSSETSIPNTSSGNMPSISSNISTNETPVSNIIQSSNTKIVEKLDFCNISYNSIDQSTSKVQSDSASLNKDNIIPDIHNLLPSSISISLAQPTSKVQNNNSNISDDPNLLLTKTSISVVPSTSKVENDSNGMGTVNVISGTSELLPADTSKNFVQSASKVQSNFVTAKEVFRSQGRALSNTFIVQTPVKESVVFRKKALKSGNGIINVSSTLASLNNVNSVTSNHLMLQTINDCSEKKSSRKSKMPQTDKSLSNKTVSAVNVSKMSTKVSVSINKVIDRSLSTDMLTSNETGSFYNSELNEMNGKDCADNNSETSTFNGNSIVDVFSVSSSECSAGMAEICTEEETNSNVEITNADIDVEVKTFLDAFISEIFPDVSGTSKGSDVDTDTANELNNLYADKNIELGDSGLDILAETAFKSAIDVSEVVKGSSANTQSDTVMLTKSHDFDSNTNKRPNESSLIIQAGTEIESVTDVSDAIKGSDVNIQSSKSYDLHLVKNKRLDGSNLNLQAHLSDFICKSAGGNSLSDSNTSSKRFNSDINKDTRLHNLSLQAEIMYKRTKDLFNTIKSLEEGVQPGVPSKLNKSGGNKNIKLDNPSSNIQTKTVSDSSTSEILISECDPETNNKIVNTGNANVNTIATSEADNSSNVLFIKDSIEIDGVDLSTEYYTKIATESCIDEISGTRKNEILKNSSSCSTIPSDPMCNSCTLTTTEKSDTNKMENIQIVNSYSLCAVPNLQTTHLSQLNYGQSAADSVNHLYGGSMLGIGMQNVAQAVENFVWVPFHTNPRNTSTAELSHNTIYPQSQMCSNDSTPNAKITSKMVPNWYALNIPTIRGGSSSINTYFSQYHNVSNNSATGSEMTFRDCVNSSGNNCMVDKMKVSNNKSQKANLSKSNMTEFSAKDSLRKHGKNSIGSEADVDHRQKIEVKLTPKVLERYEAKLEEKERRKKERYEEKKILKQIEKTRLYHASNFAKVSESKFNKIMCKQFKINKSKRNKKEGQQEPEVIVYRNLVTLKDKIEKNTKDRKSEMIENELYNKEGQGVTMCQQVPEVIVYRNLVTSKNKKNEKIAKDRKSEMIGKELVTGAVGVCNPKHVSAMTKHLISESIEVPLSKNAAIQHAGVCGYKTFTNAVINSKLGTKTSFNSSNNCVFEVDSCNLSMSDTSAKDNSAILGKSFISFEENAPDVLPIVRNKPDIKLTAKVLELYEAKMKEKERKKKEKYELKTSLKQKQKLQKSNCKHFLSEAKLDKSSSGLKKSPTEQVQIIQRKSKGSTECVKMSQNVAEFTGSKSRTKSKDKKERKSNRTSKPKLTEVEVAGDNSENNNILSDNSVTFTENCFASPVTKNVSNHNSSAENYNAEEVYFSEITKEEAIRKAQEISFKIENSGNNTECMTSLKELDILITSFDIGGKCQFLFKALRFCRLDVESYDVKELAVNLHQKIAKSIKRASTT